MNDKQFFKSVVSDVVNNIAVGIDGEHGDSNISESVREYLWANKNERILLPNHSKHPLYDPDSIPTMNGSKYDRIKFNGMLPLKGQVPPKGKVWPIFGSENKGGIACYIDDQGKLRNSWNWSSGGDELFELYVSKDDGDSVYDVLKWGDQLPTFDPATGKSRIRQFIVWMRNRKTGYISMMLNDDSLPNSEAYPLPIFDVEYQVDSRNVFYFPIDDTWTEFPIIHDDSGNQKHAMAKKTQSADWAGIDHNSNKRWQNWMTVGRDVVEGDEYYGFDLGWEVEGEELGRVTNTTTPEGFQFSAIYQKGNDEKALFIESKDAWDNDRNLFTIHADPKQERIIFKRDPDVDGGYRLEDFGRYLNLDQKVGDLFGIAIHSKEYAVPEWPTPIYFWAKKGDRLTMPNEDDHPRKKNNKMRPYGYSQETEISFKFIMPTEPPKENKQRYSFFGVKGHGAASMPFAISNESGVAKWMMRNTQIVSESQEKLIVEVDGVPVRTGMVCDLDGKVKHVKVRFKPNKSGYFFYIGTDPAYQSSINLPFPTPIYDLVIKDKDGVMLVSDMLSGWTNGTRMPDLTGNQNYIEVRGGTKENFAPMKPDGSKDEANAGKA